MRDKRPYLKRYYRRNRTKALADAKANYERNREERVAGMRQRRVILSRQPKQLALPLQKKSWQSRNPDRVRAIRIKSRHGITHAEYERMLDQQDGGCAICATPECETKRKRLCIDHDHSTDKIRGLLCDDCNKALGQFKDCPARLRSAAAYVETRQ